MNRGKKALGNRPAIPFSAEELEFIKENVGLTRKALLPAFLARFDRKDVTYWSLVSIRQRHGWMKYHEDVRGQPRKVTVDEPFDKNGYVMVRVRGGVLGGKRTSKQSPKHRLLWEEKHGPIPKGMVLKALGPIGNPDPSNWTLVSRNVCNRLSNMPLVAFNAAPDELQASMLGLAELKETLRISRRKTRKRAEAQARTEC